MRDRVLKSLSSKARSLSALIPNMNHWAGYSAPSVSYVSLPSVQPPSLCLPAPVTPPYHYQYTTLSSGLDSSLGYNLVQKRFIHNFAFSNCEFFHPTRVTSRAAAAHCAPQCGLNMLAPSRTSTSQEQTSTTDQTLHPYQTSNTDTRKTDITHQSNHTDHSTSHHSHTAQSSDQSSMHPRGQKRHSDYNRPSPEQKKARSDVVNNHDAHKASGEEISEVSDGEVGGQEDKQQIPAALTKTPPAFLTPAEHQRISDVIWSFYDGRAQVQELYVKKMKLRDALYAVMKDVFPYCGLYVVGSSMNGFGSQTSDMDLCLMISHIEIDQKKEATEILRILFKSLRKCSFLRELILVRAKVPILKFKDKISGVECDLNINNSVGIRNTHLLNAYSKMDSRVAPLVLYVKHWAKSQNINDASQGTVSSYSLVLMILHFLQVGCAPPVIPSLQQKYQHKFNANVDIRLLTLNEKLPSYTSPNKQTVGELFVAFLHYYAYVFRYEEEAISVRLGSCVPRELVTRQNPTRNPPSQWKCLCIEEPFDLSNTARSVYDNATFKHIVQVWKKSFAQIRKTGNIDDIINKPL